MNVNKISTDLYKYFNFRLREHLGYNEKYTIEIEEEPEIKRNVVRILVQSETGISTLSSYYINPDDFTNDVLEDFEEEIELYLRHNVPGFRSNLLEIYYEPESIIIKFTINF